MLGNIILSIKTFFIQNLFCIHKYKIVNRRDNGGSFYECENIKL